MNTLDSSASSTEEKPDELRTFVVGPLETNCIAYVSGGECLVIDPGAAGERLAQALSDVRVTKVVATHGHGDHVGGVAALCRATGATWALHKADEALAQTAGHLQALGRSYDEDAPAADYYLAEGDEVVVGTARFAVLEVPGHTPGGIALVGRGSATGVTIVGDTLFPGSHGRTDLPGGNEEQIMESLARLAHEVDPGDVLICGHGPTTTMERELAYNPFLPKES